MLDSVVLRYYLNTEEFRALLPGTESKAKAADVAMQALALFRADLIHSRGAIDALRASVEHQRFHLTPVRVLELLVWMEVEPAGYYR